ncbi:MAG: cytochrome PufQ [Pseudomonadota bacterium]
MTDHTASYSHARQDRQARGVEFWFYFALIFVAALPFAVFAWARVLGRDGKGIVRRAWAEADAIVPTIFSA